MCGYDGVVHAWVVIYHVEEDAWVKVDEVGELVASDLVLFSDFCFVYVEEGELEGLA